MAGIVFIALGSEFLGPLESFLFSFASDCNQAVGSSHVAKAIWDCRLTMMASQSESECWETNQDIILNEAQQCKNPAKKTESLI